MDRSSDVRDDARANGGVFLSSQNATPLRCGGNEIFFFKSRPLTVKKTRKRRRGIQAVVQHAGDATHYGRRRFLRTTIGRAARPPPPRNRRNATPANRLRRRRRPYA